METKEDLSRQLIVTVLQDGQRMLTKAFDQGPVTIGRQPGCDLILNFPFISRTHCRIVEEGGQFFLLDLNSRNGMTFDGQPFQRLQLVTELQVQIENVEINFKLIGETKQPGIKGQEAIETVIRRVPTRKEGS